MVVFGSRRPFFPLWKEACEDSAQLNQQVYVHIPANEYPFTWPRLIIAATVIGCSYRRYNCFDSCCWADYLWYAGGSKLILLNERGEWGTDNYHWFLVLSLGTVNSRIASMLLPHSTNLKVMHVCIKTAVAVISSLTVALFLSFAPTHSGFVASNF